MKGKISTHTFHKARLVSSFSSSFSRFNSSYLPKSVYLNLPSSRSFYSPPSQLCSSFFFLSPMTPLRPSSRLQHLSHHLPSLHSSRVRIFSSVLFCTYLLCTSIHSASSFILTSLDSSFPSSSPPALGISSSSDASSSSSSFPSISFEAFAFSPSSSSPEKTPEDPPSLPEKQREDRLSLSEGHQENPPANSSLGALSGESGERTAREILISSSQVLKGRKMSSEDRTSLTSQQREERKEKEEKDEKKNTGEFRMGYVTCKDRQQGSEVRSRRRRDVFLMSMNRDKS